MLTHTQLKEIRKHLEQSQNPLFFFDNDVDGLCSFLILQRAINRGKGVAIKSFPELDKSYLRKIEELNPDYVFILDKPQVSREFIEEVCKKAIPIIWIDHHNIQAKEEILKKVSYYNSCPTAEPTTYIAQNIFKRKEDIWLAMLGCISDVYMPDFAEEFSENYPELFNSRLTAFDSLYLTKIGEFIRMLNFGLMDTTTNVIKLIKYLAKAKSIYDISEENYITKQLHLRYNQLNKVYKKLVEKAESQVNENPKLIFFEYSGQTSVSSEIANALYFKHKEKIIVVAFKREDKINLSIRGKNARELTLKITEKISGASGGGHEQATGAQIPIDKFKEFKEYLRNLI